MTDQITQVRLLINDPTGSSVYSDDEIQAFLDLAASAAAVPAAQSKKAAALACDAIASNEALVLKVITDHGLSTNGAAVATALRAQATALRTEAELDLARDPNGEIYASFVPGAGLECDDANPYGYTYY